MAKCLSCGDEFEGLRSTAKYCSDICKLAYHRERLSVSKDGVSVSEPVSVSLDIERDLKLDLKKDLGVTAWTKDGIFIRDDITVEQVQNIRKLVAAKNGWPEERNFLYWCGVHRQYKPGECV